MGIRFLLKAAGGLAGVAAGLAAALPAAAITAPEIHVISNRADLVAGGDALVEIKWPVGTNVALAKIALDGVNIKSAFAPRENGRYMGLVSGLKLGNNVLTARIPGGGAQITIKNHPVGGPVFSGPHLQPWLCRTGNQNNPQLPGTPDADCNVPTVVELFYRNAGNTAFVAYNPASPPAAELVASTTTDQGKTVPYIVQRVTGTANRGIYQIAVLVDPSKPITPWSTQQPWNGKVYNSFGGACAVNHQQPTVGNQLSRTAQLARGYAVAESSMNTLGNQCSDLLSAESLMMTKEIIAKRYGPIRFTVGEGGSAGSMQQHFISEAYPGLLNGLLTSLVYDDHWGQVVGSHDCMLLFKAFGVNQASLGITGQTVNPLFPNAAERQKVWGSNPARPDGLCGDKAAYIAAEIIANDSGCAGPTGAWRWNAVTNPTGTRCTIQDYLKAVFGTTPDGKAKRPLDNVGVQYGLVSLMNGALSAEQFVDINHRVGGLTIDGAFQPQRTEAEPFALEALYRTGRNISGRGAASVAEIDHRNNTNATDFHPPFHSWTYRARMDRTNGHHANQVIWVNIGGTTPNLLQSMDDWLTALEADTSSDPLPMKIARNKPAAVFDACHRPGGVVLPNNLFCEGNGDWRYYAAPRLMSGWAFTNDTMKCQLKPLNAAEYPVSFTADQWAKLNEAFPTGVCDWTKPGVGEQPSVPWLTYAGGPGGLPLGDAPKSTWIP